MKKPADSVILATINLALVGLAFLGRFTHVGCCSIGSPANILAMVFVPILLVVSVFFFVRDLIRPPTRLQAGLALVLSIPSAVLVFSTHLG